MLEILSEPQRWVIPAVLVVAAIGAVWAVWRERRRPSSYTRRRDPLAAWKRLSADQQEAVDTASLNLAEQAVLDAEEHAREAVQSLDLERRAQANALFHP